jgi:hypothetical protein
MSFMLLLTFFQMICSIFFLQSNYNLFFAKKKEAKLKEKNVSFFLKIKLFYFDKDNKKNGSPKQTKK